LIEPEITVRSIGEFDYSLEGRWPDTADSVVVKFRIEDPHKVTMGELFDLAKKVRGAAEEERRRQKGDDSD